MERRIRPSLLAGFVSLFAADYFLFPPTASLAIQREDALGFAVFAAVALLVGTLTGSLHRTRRRADAEVVRSAALERRTTDLEGVQAAHAAAEREASQSRNREARLERTLEQLEFATAALRRSNDSMSREAAERSRAEQALRESEARLTAFLEQVPLGLGMLDTQGRWLIRNRALIRLFGEFMPSRDQEAISRWHGFDAVGSAVDPSQWPGARALRGEIVPGTDFLYTEPAGSEIWMRVSAAPFRDATRAVVGAIVAIENIDEDRRAAGRANVVNRITEALFRHATLDAVLDELLEQVRIAFAVDEAAFLLNEEQSAELIVRSAHGIDPRARSIRVPLGSGMAGRVAETRRSVIIPDLADVEVVNPYLRGAIHSLMAVPLLVKDQLLGVLHVGTAVQHDFTLVDRALLELLAERVAPIVERASLADAERAARAEAEIARQEAQSANRAKAEFLAVVSHDLRTPLNAIAGYAQHLEMEIHGPLNERQRNTVLRIQHGGQRMTSLLTDLLHVARIEAGQISYDITALPLHELLAGLEAEIAPQLEQKRLRYTYRTCDTRLAILADRSKLEQVLLNLLINAIKFTDDGGRIVLHVVATRDHLAIRVRDTGRGIEADELETIFKPFVQVGLGRVSQEIAGVGLGLSIARGLARSMDGDVVARSVPGRGSVFSVRLRRAAAVPATM